MAYIGENALDKMARPREFDIDEALDAAIGIFWSKGYTSTSMADLMEAMHLQKGSIYKAFGSKHELFLAALKKYLSRAFFYLRSRMDSAATPMAALRLYMMSSVETCRMNPEKGCFALNAVSELAPHDADTNTCLANHFASVVQYVTDQIVEGQKLGQIRTDQPATDIAEYLSTIQLGIASSAKHKGNPDAKEKVVEFALTQIVASEA